MGERLQAKDLDEEVFLKAAASGPVIRWEFQRAEFPTTPPKVVMAKWKSLIKRGLVDGCACGCRGDFCREEKADG